MKSIKVALLLFILVFGLTATSSGHPAFLKEVKKLGIDAKDCTYCHESAKGGKGWNRRGLWLKDQKKERKAPNVDVKWLKEYTE
ncbi:MAG: hypothetical protein JNN15_00045 [Blastocatellia bacterium]|nr:hypothetical protein [Blastocatellia bacterium]